MYISTGTFFLLIPAVLSQLRGRAALGAQPGRSAPGGSERASAGKVAWLLGSRTEAAVAVLLQAWGAVSAGTHA